MLYVMLKIAHILSVTLFFGTGLGSVYYKLRADRSGDVALMAATMKSVVLADNIFTIPSAILLPLTGVGMCQVGGLALTTQWVLVGFGLYVLAGLTWLPAYFLQYRMLKFADEAAQTGEPMHAGYHHATRIWAILGIPSFLAVMAAITIMVGKGVVLK